MNSKEFKNVFGEVAKTIRFESAFGGWFKESSESIIVLDLQKSHFGDYYEMNIKVYIQGMFGNHYTRNKDLVKKNIGNVFRRQPSEYNDVLDFDTYMDDETRKNRLEKLFVEFIVPFTDKALSKSGLNTLSENGEIIFLPAVRKELALL